MEIFKSIKQLEPYAYEMEYTDLDYEYGYKHFKNDDAGEASGCTVVRNGSVIGRNFDFIYNENAIFAIKINATADHYASIGVSANIPGLTDEVVQSGVPNVLYKVVPFRTLDGINEHGLFVATNVVPIDYEPTTHTIAEVSMEHEICARMLPRYLLDHCQTARAAAEYVRDHLSVYMPKSITDMHYELHLFLADATDTLVLEFIDDYTEIIDVSTYPWMANYYLHNVTFNSDNTLYTPETKTDTHSAMTTNGITAHGSGLERSNYIAAHHDSAATVAGMRQLMSDIYYTHAYDSATNPFWFSEFVDGPVTVDSDLDEFADTIYWSQYAYERRTRDPASPYYGTWQTTHSTVYDLTAHTLYLTCQEHDTQYVIK